MFFYSRMRVLFTMKLRLASLLACLLQPACGFAVATLRTTKAARCSVHCGLFDAFSKVNADDLSGGELSWKIVLRIPHNPLSMSQLVLLTQAFENKDYTTSPATYEQSNARASHILVDTEEQANDIKAQLAAGTLDFAGAASQFSKCPSGARGGKLGKFVPGAMVPEFDDVVFGLYDTGGLNPRNEAAVFEPKYEVDVVHGPVKTKEGFHLIKIETRYIADFDFRLKNEPTTEL